MFELYNFKLYKFWVANSYTLQAVLEQTLMSRGTPLPTVKTTYFVDFVYDEVSDLMHN